MGFEARRISRQTSGVGECEFIRGNDPHVFQVRTVGDDSLLFIRIADDSVNELTEFDRQRIESTLAGFLITLLTIHKYTERLTSSELKLADAYMLIGTKYLEAIKLIKKLTETRRDKTRAKADNNKTG